MHVWGNMLRPVNHSMAKVRVRVQRLSHIAGRVCVSACCHLVNMHMTPDLHNLVPHSHHKLCWKDQQRQSYKQDTEGKLDLRSLNAFRSLVNWLYLLFWQGAHCIFSLLCTLHALQFIQYDFEKSLTLLNFKSFAGFHNPIMDGD